MSNDSGQLHHHLQFHIAIWVRPKYYISCILQIHPIRIEIYIDIVP